MRVGIVGAGLAGLTCGIRLRLAGAEVEIFDKQRIPGLKVCGEYLSLEVLPLMEQVGIDLNLSLHPLIDRLTCCRGNHSLQHLLPLGGIGISRQTLDGAFKRRFLDLGGQLHEQAKVQLIDSRSITFDADRKQSYDYVVNASGRLNPFGHQEKKSGTTYVGYKKQVPAQGWLPNRIHLEFYEWGYLGFNQIENGQLCICNLIKQSHLKSLKSIDAFEQSIKLNDASLEIPFRISSKKAAVSNFQFYRYKINEYHTIGDAAGNIPPLVGNGMSLAILSGDKMGNMLANGLTSDFASQNRRIQAGLLLNTMSMSSFAGLGIELLGRQSSLAQKLVSLTHGQPT